MSAGGSAWLFVPGDRPERFARAAASGAGEIILDLEDAVRAEAKDLARVAVADYVRAGARCWVRINAVGSALFDEDMSALDGLGPAGVVVPKSESVEDIGAIAAQLRPETSIVALVETARGLEAAGSLAAHPRVCRLAFGSVDFALDIGADHEPEALLLARSLLVVASRAADSAAPLDGVTTALDIDATRADARRARALGMGGKLCIHPAQVRPVLDGFRPSQADLDIARRVVAAADASSQGAVLVDGRMVDKPVVERARRLLNEDAT